jgi:hypothetical protein
MSYQTAKRERISKEPIFSWWLVDNVDDTEKWGKYASYARNVRTKGASLTTRPWYYEYVVLSSRPISIESYWDVAVVRTNKDTNKKLVTIDKDRNIIDITTTWIASDAHINFTNAWGALYCMNWVDSLTKLVETTHSVVSCWIADFKPTFSVVFNSSHFASWRDVNPTVVYKSVWDDFDVFAGSGSDTYKFPETITWLATSQQSLFYFTKNTITVTSRSDVAENWGAYSYVTTPLSAKEWATNHRTIVTAGNDLYCLTPSKKIVKIARGANIEGFEIIDISHRKYRWIDNFMSELNNTQDNARWYYDSINNRCIRHLQTYWEAKPTIILIYDVSLDLFLIDDGKQYTDTCIHNGFVIATSRYENKIFIDEDGNTDNWSIIQSRYETKEYAITDETIKKVIRETRTPYILSMPWSFTQEIWVDWYVFDKKTISTTYTGVWGIGTSEVATFSIWSEWWVEQTVSGSIVRTKANLNKRFNKIKFVRYNETRGTKFTIKWIETKVEILAPIVTNL